MGDQLHGVTIVRATGTSMGESIRAGDWLFVSPHRPRLGDVALVEHDGRLIAHRVIGRHPLRLSGDTGVVAHRAAPEAVRGRVVTVVREGARTELTGVRARADGLRHVMRSRARIGADAQGFQRRRDG